MCIIQRDQVRNWEFLGGERENHVATAGKPRGHPFHFQAQQQEGCGRKKQLERAAEEAGPC